MIDKIHEEILELYKLMKYDPAAFYYHGELRQRFKDLRKQFIDHYEIGELNLLLNCPVCKRGNLKDGRCLRCGCYKNIDDIPKGEYLHDVLPADQEGVRLRGLKTSVDKETGEILSVVTEYLSLSPEQEKHYRMQEIKKGDKPKRDPNVDRSDQTWVLDII